MGSTHCGEIFSRRPACQWIPATKPAIELALRQTADCDRAWTDAVDRSPRSNGQTIGSRLSRSPKRSGEQIEIRAAARGESEPPLHSARPAGACGSGDKRCDARCTGKPRRQVDWRNIAITLKAPEKGEG